MPVVSMPRRPARPAIWMYSPASRLRMHVPSCFRTLSNTTVRAGMFTPIANVSVANRIWGQRKNEFNDLFPGSGNVAASNADWNHPTEEAGTGPSLAVSTHFNTRCSLFCLCFASQEQRIFKMIKVAASRYKTVHGKRIPKCSFWNTKAMFTVAHKLCS